MDYDKLTALALAFPILAATSTPALAEACPGGYDPCGYTDRWVDLSVVNATSIPSDGVLVLQGTHEGGDGSSLAAIDLTVTRDGQPLAGALETTSIHGVLVWRPLDPWEAGATYALSGAVTNPPEAEGCALLMIPIEDTLHIDVAPGATIGAAEFSGETKVELSPQIALDTLACCEGATPSIGYGYCGAQDVYWDPAECAPTRATGYLSVQLNGQPAASGAAAAQIIYTLKVNDGIYATSLTPQFSVVTDAPFCAVIEALDLASGAVTDSQKHCFGDAVVDQLGTQILDPAEKLSCALEQCAPNGDVWDPTTCTPVDPSHPTSSDSDDTASDSSSGSGTDTAGEGDGDRGCGCDGGGGGDAGLLALVGLLGLGKRGRRRRARHR